MAPFRASATGHTALRYGASMSEIRWTPSRGWTVRLERDGMIFQATLVCAAPEAPWSVLGAVLPPQGVDVLDQLIELDPVELGDYGTEHEAQRVAERFVRNALAPARLTQLLQHLHLKTP